ncbi:MAG: hypothetical protein WBA28_07235 [Microbacteriaceae bacterium]
MQTVRDIIVILHILGAAGIIGGSMMEMSKMKTGLAKINGAIMHSAWLMLLTGVGLVGMAYARNIQPDNMKIGIKMLVLIVIVVLALINRGKNKTPASWVIPTIASLTVVNICIAVLWH